MNDSSLHILRIGLICVVLIPIASATASDSMHYDKMYRHVRKQKNLLWDNSLRGRAIEKLIAHPSYLQLVERVILNMDRKVSVLDLGCEQGERMHDFLGPQFSTVGVDISPTALDIAANQYADDTHSHRPSLLRADVRALPFNTPFDIVLAYGVGHALNGRDETRNLVSYMSRLQAPDSLAVFVNFTNELPLSVEAHPGLSPDMLSPREILSQFNTSGYRTLWSYTGPIATATHPDPDSPTGHGPEHEHSLIWLVAQKIRESDRAVAKQAD